MIVRCASCETEFVLDDNRVGSEGTTARCSRCGAVFPVEPPQGAVAQPWQVRTIDDLLFTAPDLQTLHSWILEGRLHPDDKVSRSGRNFVRLGEIPEFAEAFAGFVGLPGVLEAEPDRGASEHSALDVLGPPPAFGTHAGEEGADALAGVPEPTTLEPSSMLGQLIDDAASASSSSVVADALVARAREPEVAVPVATTSGRNTPPPIPRGGGQRRPTPVPSPRGVPAVISDDRSSRPQSMLDVVTQHVRPITSPVVETTRAERAATPRPPPAPRAPDPPQEVVAVSPPEAPTRRGGGWVVWAALGILAGGAVVFGIPQIRERVLGRAPAAPVEVADAGAPSLDQARAAIAACDPEALAQAAAALQAAVDGGKASTEVRATAAETFATRAVVHELWASVEPSVRSDARFWAQEDAARAAALLAGLESAPEAARASALLRIVHGRADADGLEVGAEERLIVAVAPLLRDAAAKLPAAVITDLEELPQRSVLAELVLALGHVRAGDAERARALANGVLAARPTQPVARALAREAPLSGPPAKPDAPIPDKPTVDTGGDTKTDEPVVVANDTPAEESPARLIDRGCRKSEGGDADGAVALLTKALAKRPTDVDGLLCMGDAQSRLGSWSSALSHYERALARAPNMMSALAGAARAAAKLGRTSKAVGLYERLLEQDPSHSQAKAYVAANKSGEGSPGDNPG